MCGITGILSKEGGRGDQLRERVQAMSQCIAHRGPDDSGSWHDVEAGVALGFRRLSIIDLSAAGHQPMTSTSGRFTIVFNGEVYNYIELKVELEHAGARFDGHSDTEVILAAFERWGVESAVKKFIGMFAIAAWDAQNRHLSLVRDRLGIKPLFYYHRPGLLTFGSELKALVAGPEFDRAIDESALDAFLRYLYVPAPQTIYRHARKVLPGHILTIDDVGGELPQSLAYWSLEEAYAAGRNAELDASDASVGAELRRLLSDAVRLRMRSDVPMGALLSGGIDSSTVVALMQEQSIQPTRTFSIGFPGTPHDESRHAAAVAHALGTAHTEMHVSGDDALAVIPQLADMFDEPFADPSQIPTFLVCKLAREHVTVALTGDGGDEVFAGYERYIQGERLIGKMGRIPRMIRHAAAMGIGSLSTRRWDQVYRHLSAIVQPSGSHRLAGEKIRKLGTLLQHDSLHGMYDSLLSVGWQTTPVMLSETAPSRTRPGRPLDGQASVPALDHMMLVDQQTYLSDDLLAKVDRASMRVSLEARVPLLDHRVIEFAWRLSRRHKIRNGQGKWALRQVLGGFIDPALFNRPKTGFSVPLAQWLRGPLRQWSEELLFGSLPREGTWLSPERVRSAWDALQRGGDDTALAIWAALMFRSWQQRWLA